MCACVSACACVCVLFSVILNGSDSDSARHGLRNTKNVSPMFKNSSLEKEFMFDYGTFSDRLIFTQITQSNKPWPSSL